MIIPGFRKQCHANSAWLPRPLPGEGSQAARSERAGGGRLRSKPPKPPTPTPAPPRSHNRVWAAAWGRGSARSPGTLLPPSLRCLCQFFKNDSFSF